MDAQEFVRSKKFNVVLVVVGAVVVALIIFQAGIFVGYHKAQFSGGFGDNYYRAFGGRGGPGNIMFSEEDIPGGHGSAGVIVKLQLPNIVIEDRDGTERVIVVKDDTVVRSSRDTLKASDLKVDDFVTVIGSPNAQSQIEAKLIRVLPPPPDTQATSSVR